MWQWLSSILTLFNWDYFKNAEHDDFARNDIDVARGSSVSSTWAPVGQQAPM